MGDEGVSGELHDYDSHFLYFYKETNTKNNEIWKIKWKQWRYELTTAHDRMVIVKTQIYSGNERCISMQIGVWNVLWARNAGVPENL